LDGPVDRKKTLPDAGSSPRPFEVHALVALDREITLVRLAELGLRHADEPAVDIHEPRHVTPLPLTGPDTPVSV
jgi:hypothetical protein